MFVAGLSVRVDDARNVYLDREIPGITGGWCDGWFLFAAAVCDVAVAVNAATLAAWKHQQGM